MQKAVMQKAVMQKEDVVMPGYDPASMNPESWIADQFRNDSQGAGMTAFFHHQGVPLWIHVS